MPRGALQFLLLTLAKRADFGFLRRNTPRLAAGIGAGRAERIYFRVMFMTSLINPVTRLRLSLLALRPVTLSGYSERVAFFMVRGGRGCAGMSNVRPEHPA